ncbi:CsbD family protein [Microvirga yunnanensis]|uniref:CsbD family protein n=1 Tax=Microvirga yunnanensis TaxID=2953740 RepID=UPI0021C99ABD|nr:CsbD family protein [Microvirga sp. HBU65207]
MDRDRIEGGAKTLGGRVKEFFGRILGDTKLRTEGRMDQVEGKIQNTVGGIKDSLRDDGRRGP